MKRLVALACLSLAACGSPDALRFADVQRTFAQNFEALPFADGPVYVVAEERGEMKTYHLVPCRSGTHICAGGLHGRAGHKADGPGYTQVTGAYRGREFRLMPGGSGELVRGGVVTPLAWE